MHVGEQIEVVRHDHCAWFQRRLQTLQHRQVKLLPTVQEEKRHAVGDIPQSLESVALP